MCAVVLAALWPGVAFADPGEVRELIHKYAVEYGLDEQVFLRVAWCESRLRAGAVGDGGESVGVFQFHARGLWRWTPFAHLGLDARYDAETNIHAAAWSWARGYQKHWSCYGR